MDSVIDVDIVWVSLIVIQVPQNPTIKWMFFFYLLRQLLILLLVRIYLLNQLLILLMVRILSQSLLPVLVLRIYLLSHVNLFQSISQVEYLFFTM